MGEDDLRRLAGQACVEAGAPPHTALDLLADGTWIVTVGTTCVYVDPDEPPVEILARLVDAVSEYGSEEAERWGVAMPACPGHAHPARVSTDSATVVLTCPVDGGEIRRIVPVVTP